MKTLIKILFISTVSFSAMAKSVVLVSYYEAVGTATFNNSERVANALAENLKNDSSFEITLCALPTSYNRAYANVEKCLQNMNHKPDMYLGIGEFGCAMRMETMGRNLDKTLGAPDNDGTTINAPIVPGAAQILAFNHPAPEMYCSLSPKMRNSIQISNNAGSFICNSTAYKFATYYPEIPSGFIHVPSNFCKNINQVNLDVVSNLSSMLRSAVATLVQENGMSPRLPLTKKEMIPLRSNKADACRSEFFKRMKASDETGLF